MLEKKQKLLLEIVSRKWHLIYSPNMAYYLYVANLYECELLIEDDFNYSSG